jgi:hypothetical protein
MVFMPQGQLAGSRSVKAIPASKPVTALVTALMILTVYGGLGVLGRHLSLKLGIPDLLDSNITNRRRFLRPALSGIGIGLVLIAVDTLFASRYDAAPLPHPPFPTSLAASVVAGIGEELIFRLFFISFWVWLVSHLILRKRAGTRVYWMVALASAAVFAAAHLPSVMILAGLESIELLPLHLVVEIFLLNGIVSLGAAYHFKNAGFLGAAGVHLWTDIVWHVIWGLV